MKTRNTLLLILGIVALICGVYFYLIYKENSREMSSKYHIDICHITKETAQSIGCTDKLMSCTMIFMPGDNCRGLVRCDNAGKLVKDKLFDTCVSEKAE